MKFETVIDTKKRKLTPKEALELAKLEILQMHTHPDGSAVELRPVRPDQVEGIEEIVEGENVEVIEGFKVHQYDDHKGAVGFHCACEQIMFFKWFGDGTASIDVVGGHSEKKKGYGGDDSYSKDEPYEGASKNSVMSYVKSRNNY